MSLLLLFIVVIIGVSYGYVSKIIEGTKQNKLVAGILDLELFEGEEVVIENLYPQANPVGLIQEESYDFKLINKTDNDTSYILKLQKIETPNELELTDVVYGLTKDNVSSTNLLSEMEDGIIDRGTIKGNQTINYELRFWLREDIEDDTTTNLKTLKYKLIVDGSQKIANNPSAVEVKLFADDNLGENCKTYDDGTDTFLVGQCSQNYVWYSGKLWRVVLKNNETGVVKMVTDNVITVIPYKYYNPSIDIAFENSNIDQWLIQEFLPTLHDYNNFLVVDSVWDTALDASDIPSRPSEKTSIERTVGLLNRYEYYTTYNNSDGLATYMNGYLKNNVNWVLQTIASTQSIYDVNTNGVLGKQTSPYPYGVRPTVNLKSEILISGGTGEIDNPYILEGDIQAPENGSTLLNARYSGEYVIFNNELYRIVGVEQVEEEKLTKIVAVDKPSEFMSNAFDSSDSATTDFATATIKTDLENYYQSLDDTIKVMVKPNTTWYLGTVGFGNGYKQSICATPERNVSISECEKTTIKTTSNIGLPRVGEMFTSQITRGTKSNFWTLTPYNDSKIRFGGRVTLEEAVATSTYGARPSMYLKSNVVIASNNTGNGTYEYPYKIELGT